MRFLVLTLFAVFSTLSQANDKVDKISALLKDPLVSQAIDNTIAEGLKNNKELIFNGVVIGFDSACVGDRADFDLLFDGTIKKDGDTQFQKCTLGVSFGKCEEISNKVISIADELNCEEVD